MRFLRSALLLPLAAALLARAEIAELSPIVGMLLLGARATGRFSLPPNRIVLPLLSIPFILQASLLPADTGYLNLLKLYGIGAHYLFWIAVQQAVTRGRENGALPFALGSIGSASLHLPPGEIWLPLLAIPLLPLALLPVDSNRSYSRMNGKQKSSWLLLWLLAIALMVAGNSAAGKMKWRWSGWTAPGHYPLLGFSERSDLNRPPGEWSSRRKNQIVLRLYGEECRIPLSGKNYQFYRNGVWSATGENVLREPSGKRVSHQIYGYEEPQQEWLWVESLLPLEGTLFVPHSLSAIAILSDSLTLTAEGSPRFATGEETRSPWLVQSSPNLSRDLPEELRLFTPPRVEDLALQETLKPWIDSLTHTLFQQEKETLSAEESVTKIQLWLWSQFRYAWRNPSPVDGEPLKGFVAEKVGYCDHYASLMTLMLRSAGIPARFSKGYLPGVKMGGSCAVRRIEAHSWVIAWIGGKWERIEATPPFGMEREEMGWFRVQKERMSALTSQLRLAIFHGKWRLWLEEGANRSQGWVTTGALLLSLALFLFLIWKSWRQQRLPPKLKLWPKITRLLRAEGITPGVGENGEELLDHLSSLPPKRRLQRAIELLREYQKKRWRP